MLSELKEVVDSCHYDENQTFGAVLVEIKDTRLKAEYGWCIDSKLFNFEVWSNGIMLYQRQLHKPPKAWNMCR